VSGLEWLGVAMFGGAGAYARFLVDAIVSSSAGRELPAGTLVVNLSGAFLLGVLVGAMVDPNVYRLAGTATIGSYTTFSTWQLETHRMVEEGELRAAAANVIVSLLLGLGVAALGRSLGGAL
jgi:fluoride exporter